MEYVTGRYKFVDENGWVNVYRSGEYWGVPQGDKFLRVLLKDIKKLEDKLEKVNNLIEDNTRLDAEDILDEIEKAIR